MIVWTCRLIAVEVKPPRFNEVDRPQLVVEAGCGCPFTVIVSKRNRSHRHLGKNG